MPGMYDADRARPMPDIGRKLWDVDYDETKCLNMIKEGEKLVNMLTDWEVQQTERRPREGRKDGQAVTDFKYLPQAVLEAYAGHQLEPWKVTKVTSLTSTAGVKNTAEHQSMMALRQLRLAMERMALSDQEMQRGTSMDEYLLRGIFTWLQATAQAVKPVPDDYRPTSEQVYTGALADLTEETFEDTMMGAAWSQTNGAALTLDGFVGQKLKSRMSKWAKLVDTTTTLSSTLNRNISVESKKHISPVNVFEFETGIVRNHLSANLLVDASGALTAESSRSGAFLNLDVWEKRFLQSPQRFKLTDDGSGEQGYADTLWSLQCNNPKGQLLVKTGT